MADCRVNVLWPISYTAIALTGNFEAVKKKAVASAESLVRRPYALVTVSRRDDLRVELSCRLVDCTPHIWQYSVMQSRLDLVHQNQAAGYSRYRQRQPCKPSHPLAHHCQGYEFGQANIPPNHGKSACRVLLDALQPRLNNLKGIQNLRTAFLLPQPPQTRGVFLFIPDARGKDYSVYWYRGRRLLGLDTLFNHAYSALHLGLRASLE